MKQEAKYKVSYCKSEVRITVIAIESRGLIAWKENSIEALTVAVQNTTARW